MQDVLNKYYLTNSLEGSFIKKLSCSNIIKERKERGELLEKKSKDYFAYKIKQLLTSTPDSSTLEKINEILGRSYEMDKSLMTYTYNALTQFCHFDLMAELVLISEVYTNLVDFSTDRELYNMIRQFYAENKGIIDSLENCLNENYGQRINSLSRKINVSGFISIIDSLRTDETLSSSTNPLIDMMRKNLEGDSSSAFKVYRQLSEANQLFYFYQLSTDYPLNQLSTDYPLKCTDIQRLCGRAALGLKGCIEEGITKIVEDDLSKTYSHLRCLVVKKKFNEFMSSLLDISNK